MKRPIKQTFVRYSVAGLLALLMVGPSWAQKSNPTPPPPSQPPSTKPPSQPSGSAPNAPGQPGPLNQPSNQPSSNPQLQVPLYVNGRIVMDNGQPAPEPVAVGLSCSSRTLQTIQTDLKGYFQFTLGQGPRANADFSASNDSPVTSRIGDASSTTGYGGFGRSGNDFTGCELRVSVPGYQPVSKFITDPGDITGIDAGTLQLTRIAGVQGSSISVTSLLVPDKARKEFEQGDKDAHANKLPSATQHMEKAVADYDKYAAAWNELGNLYVANHQADKAQAAFEKSIAADPKYIPPFIALASLQLQTNQNEDALNSAGKALDLDPGIATASYIEAAANFRLNRMDAAEKSALDAQKQPHQNVPQLHVLLADIFIKKQDFPAAAAQFRAYLREAPNGTLVAQVKQSLDQIEKSAPAASNSNQQSAPQVAP